MDRFCGGRGVMDEELVTNFVIERLVTRNCYLVSRDAGKILLLSNV